MGKPNQPSPGQLAYEADLLERPVYHDGTQRPTWDRLDGIAQYSWERGAYFDAQATLSREVGHGG